MDQNVVEFRPNTEVRLPQSPALMMIFWAGPTKTVPRPVWLYVEGIVAIGTAARLHVEYGWPTEALGFETQGPPKYAFDLFGVAPGRIEPYYLAAEAKSSRGLLSRLVADLQNCARRGEHDDCLAMPTPDKYRRNAHRKWQGLIRDRPRVVFAFGPGEDWHIFTATYEGPFGVTLAPSDAAALSFPT